MTPLFAIATTITILAGLWIDQLTLGTAQPAIALWTWTLLALLFGNGSPDDRARWFVCLAWATVGEVVLSLLWGVYEYRLGNLPLFVPPGHVLLYALGVWLADRLPAAVTAAVLPLALIAVPAFALLGSDTVSLPLLALFLLALRFGPSPRLYSTMFLLALAMELYGTALGSWAWQPQVPGLPLASANPPLAAGAFYCVLDWLTGRRPYRSTAPALPGSSRIT